MSEPEIKYKEEIIKYITYFLSIELLSMHAIHPPYMNRGLQRLNQDTMIYLMKLLPNKKRENILELSKTLALSVGPDRRKDELLKDVGSRVRMIIEGGEANMINSMIKKPLGNLNYTHE